MLRQLEPNRRLKGSMAVTKVENSENVNAPFFHRTEMNVVLINP